MNGLVLGAWQDVLVDMFCDVLIVDPPYGARTHKGHNAGVDGAASNYSGPNRDRSYGNARRRELSYSAFTPEDVFEFVRYWSPKTCGWFCAMSCSDLAPVWREALEEQGRCTFAPVACVTRGMTVRLQGDGPSSWTVYLNVARPRGAGSWKAGALPGAYVVTRGTIDRGKGHIGGKPLQLMRAIVRDYSRPGDLICDPCAGYGTTAIAAESLGRNFVGAEVDPVTHQHALDRLAAGVQKEMFA